MSSHAAVQVILVSLFCNARAHFIWPGGFPPERFPLYGDGPPPPVHPLPQPPPQYNLPPDFHHGPHVVLQERIPVTVVVRGVFPPFMERVIQRIQTYWSVYNPPELLTRPPIDPPPTPTPSKKKPTTTTTTTTSTTTTSAPPPSEAAETTTTTPSATEPHTTVHQEVSTLAVFEVTPSTDAPEAAATTVQQVSTLVVLEVTPSTDAPEAAVTTVPPFSLEGTEDPFYSTVEKFFDSVLQPERDNEMEDEFS